MSLQEIFHAELWGHPISWGTLLFLAALIISTISAVIALAISTIPVTGRIIPMRRGPKGEKLPADVIGGAVMVGRIATGEIEEASEIDTPEVAFARGGGQKGGPPGPQP
jgi:hypothetical protein